MDEPTVFRAAPGGRDRRDRGIAALVLVIVVAFLGLAVAKPWGSEVATATAAPSSTAPPGVAAGTLARPSSSPAALPVAPVGARAPSPGEPFTTPPPIGTAWSGVRWRRLASDDPLALVTSVVGGSGGYVATGWLASREGPATPVWTSRDGIHWDPLPFGTSTTFWPGAMVLGIIRVPAGLVAITEQVGDTCPVCAPLIPPAVSWTSPDGLAWTPHTLPPGGPVGPAGTGPLIAGGPAGIVIASTGTGHGIAISRDGVAWTLAAPDALPVGFALEDVTATADGYVAAGRWDTGNGGRAAIFTSANGRTWTARPTLLPAPAGLDGRVGTTVDRLVAGTSGIIAIGHTMTGPGRTLWWHSVDGRPWRVLGGYPPLGAASADDSSGGWLVSDGRRVLGLRGAIAWTSADGLAWARLPIGGDLPSARAAAAVLLPSGVLVSDGSASWLGEALGS